jgi:hypothetical protein
LAYHRLGSDEEQQLAHRGLKHEEKKYCAFACGRSVYDHSACNGTAADNSIQTGDDGSIRSSKFFYYDGYYYAVWDGREGAITRHKADGSESKILFSLYGLTDLAR